MLGVGDYHRAIAELHFEAGPLTHHAGDGQHPGRPAVGSDEVVARLNLSHGRPAVRRRQRRIQGQRLAEGRPGRDHDHLARVQAVGERVKAGEAGRNAGQPAAPAADRLDLVQRSRHDLGKREIVLADPPLGDPVDLRLSAVEQVISVAVARVAKLHDPGADLDQAAQDRPLAHDPGVVAGVRRRRHGGDQGVQVRGAAHPPDVPPLGQLGGDGDGVGRLAAAVQVEDHLVHELMGRPVVIMRPDYLKNVGNRVLRQQHPAEHALLSGDVVRWRPLESAVSRCDLCDAQLMPPPPAGEHSPRGPRGRSSPFYRMARTVSRQPVPASSRAVHRPVDSLCRHAASAVRSMGIGLWKWSGNRHGRAFCLRLRHPPLVRKKKIPREVRPGIAGSYPH